MSGTLLTRTLSTASQPNVTAVGTLSSLSVSGNANVGNIGASAGIYTTLSATGNITGANITGTHYGAATGLTSIPGANVTGTVSSATTAGTVTTAAQPNITSVGTLTGLTLANAAVISMGSNTNAGTLTGNFTLSTGSRLAATYS